MLRDRGLQFFHVNEEFPVSASHQLALITSLPFVHTARRYYRLNDRSEVFGLDARNPAPSGAGSSRDREDDRTRPFRGSKSRNKVSVGEPAEGSLETGPRDRRGASRRPVRRAPNPTPRPRAFDARRRSPARRDPPTDRLREKAPGAPVARPTRPCVTQRTPPAGRATKPRTHDLYVDASCSILFTYRTHTRPRTADHLARGSMKTAAICASSCNPQVIRTSTSRTHIAASVTHGSRATPV